MPSYFEFRSGLMRPKWRGQLHKYAAFATIPLGVWLFLWTNGTENRLAVLIYVLSLHGVFAVSSSYHRLTKTIGSQEFMRKLDHSMIYVLIAGTYTPICMIALKDHGGINYMMVVWTASAVGVMLTILKKMYKTTLGLYIAIGWIAVWLVPHIHNVVGLWPVSLYIAGGVVYTVGAVLFFMHRPRLAPDTFGYHEIWHVNTVIAAALHFSATVFVINQMT